MPILLGFLALFWSLPQAAAACQGLSQGFQASVARVIDAETLRLHDGAQLRLAGILAPHQHDAGAVPHAWAGAIAARAEVEALVLGKTISVSFGAERRDRYGRHLGHVFVGEAEPRWLQGHLLGQGLVRVVTRARDTACEAEMLALEKPAREARIGLWKDAAYAVRAATDIDALTAAAGHFVVVEGAVTAARRAGASLRLEFAEKGRFGLVGLVPRLKGKRPHDLTPGKRVRLRGWIEERGGRPTLDLAVIGNLEPLD